MAFAPGIQAPYNHDRPTPRMQVKDMGELTVDHYGMETIHTGPVKMKPPVAMQAKVGGQSFSVRGQTLGGWVM